MQLKTKGFAPTRAEIAEYFNFKSVNSADSHIKALEIKGAISIVSTVNRGIKVSGWVETKPEILPITEKLTKRQNEVLDFIKKELKTKGLAPTRVEIAEHFDFKSINSAEDHVKALQRKGVITITPTARRGIIINAWETLNL